MATTDKTQPPAAVADAEAEAEVADAEAGEGAKKNPAKRWLSLKLMLIMAAAVVGFGAAGGAYYFAASRSEAAPAGKVKPPVFFDMPEVLVNLSSGGSDRTQYLKVKVALELPDQALISQIKPLMPRLTDAFQTYLRELRATDLDGSAGLYRLREELTRRVNAAIAPNRINAVLFKEIVVQ
jgi:flagellar protein FliL